MSWRNEVDNKIRHLHCVYIMTRGKESQIVEYLTLPEAILHLQAKLHALEDYLKVKQLVKNKYTYEKVEKA